MLLFLNRYPGKIHSNAAKYYYCQTNVKSLRNDEICKPIGTAFTHNIGTGKACKAHSHAYHSKPKHHFFGSPDFYFICIVNVRNNRIILSKSYIIFNKVMYASLTNINFFADSLVLSFNNLNEFIKNHIPKSKTNAPETGVI